MKLNYLISILLLSLILCFNHVQSQENDFSEFDEFDEPGIKVPDNVDKPDLNKQQTVNDNADQPESNQQEQNEPIADDKDDFQMDEDEEVTVEDANQLDDELPIDDKTAKPTEKKAFEPIKLSSLPLHLRNNWASYYIEIGLVFGILLYFINFFTGSSTNQKIAENFYNATVDTLNSYFTLVGDDGTKELEKRGYVKDSDNLFVLWSTGRFGYECCIIELHLNKRQDLLSLCWNLVKPSNDQLIVKIFLKDESMDNFVFCLVNKKSGLKTVKEYNDVITFCQQKKSIEKYTFLNDNFILLNELSDVTSLVLDNNNQLLTLLSSSPELINFIHISDQFSGLKPSDQDAQPTKAPPVKKVLTFSFNFPKGLNSSTSMDEMKELITMVLNLSERVKRFKLKKDMKEKAIKNRRKVEEYYEKISNAEKQQAAQQRKEEKRRLEKEKIIDANDEMKLRKFEDREYKNRLKKLKPKMKQIRQ